MAVNKAKEVLEEYPVSEKLQSAIDSITAHKTGCPFCDNPQLSEMLINLMDQDLSFKAMALKLGIQPIIIKNHIKEILSLVPAEIFARLTLLKIINKIDTIEPGKFKASDIVRAIEVLNAFKNIKGSDGQKNSMGKISSSDLMQRRQALKKA